LERRTFRAAILAVLAGCGHGEPFQVPDPSAGGPLVPGILARLTYSPGRDRAPHWRADGSAILYTYERTDRPLHDWCLGALPPDGGSRTASWCEVAQPDTQIAYDWVAEGPNGDLAYARSATRRNAYTSGDWWVRVAPGGNFARSVAVARVGLTPPGGPTLDGVQQIRWLDPTHLVYVAERRFVGRRCRSCPVDTTITGRLLLSLDLAGSQGPQSLPGTAYATGVAVRGPDEILFTRAGDSRVLRYTVSSGAITTAHDFGQGRIARDVQVVGDKLLAVVDGVVSVGYDSALGDTAQTDLGGDLAIVDLASGSEMKASIPFPVRYPALAPDGRRALVQTPIRPEDLYLVALP
jgi:hypothetical protein